MTKNQKIFKALMLLLKNKEPININRLSKYSHVDRRYFYHQFDKLGLNNV